MTGAHAKESAYTNQLKQEFGEIIEGLNLGELQKRFLLGRWLDQVLWFESNARSNQRRYYALRLITIVCGVVVPALVSLNVRKDEVAQTLAWATFGLSLVVAISAAVEAFFRYGERWRTFRRTAEALKAQGWQFFELGGPYQAPDHATAFPSFAAQVEIVVQQDVEAFIALAKAAQPTLDAQDQGGTPHQP